MQRLPFLALTNFLRNAAGGSKDHNATSEVGKFFLNMMIRLLVPNTRTALSVSTKEHATRYVTLPVTFTFHLTMRILSIGFAVCLVLCIQL
jgi:hypothetical protein